VRVHVIICIAMVGIGCGKKTDTAQPQLKSITQAVYASGRLYPKYFYRVSSKIPGVVAEIYVKAGDSVRRGMPLIKITSTIADIGLSAAQNALSLAEDNAKETGAYLSAAAAELESARAKYSYDSISSQRLKRLLDENATSRSSYDVSATQLDVSRQQLRKAQQTYESLVQRAQVERRNARLQVAAQRTAREDYIIYAAEDGLIYDVIPNAGELINPQMVIIEIGDASEYEVELNIDETDIAFLMPGQRIVYTIDSYKQDRFEGVVSHVNPRVSAADKTAKITATITSSSPRRFLPGMSLEANIVVAEKARALVIPREYLKTGSTVDVERESSVQSLKVRTGIEDLRFVEVLEGLSTQDILVK